MPMVPRLTTPDVQTQALPNARLSGNATIEDFGGGQALQSTDLSTPARIAQQVWSHEKQKADQIAITGAEGELSASETDLLYNSDYGALNRRGSDAFSAPEEVQAAWQKQVDSLAKRMTNPDQQAAFTRAVAAHWDSMNVQMQRHVANERKTYDQDTTNTLVTNERDAGIQNFTDPHRVQLAVDRQVAALTDFAARNPGLPDGWLEAQTRQAASKTKTGVIDRMLANGQDLAARHYYDANKDDIDAADATPVERALQEGSVRGESQRQSDAIIAKHGDDLSAALTAARAISDPAVRDATETRVRQRYVEKKQDAELQRQDLFQAASNIVEKTHDSKSVPPSMWLGLNLSMRSELDNRAKQLQGGTGGDTNWQTYYDLKTLASTPETRQQFLRTNLLEYRSQLGDTEFKELIGAQTSLRNKDGVADNKLGGYRTVSQVVNDGLNGVGIRVGDKNQAGRVALFRRTVDTQVAQQEAATGKPVRAEDAQKIVDNLLVSGTVAGSGVFGWEQTTKHLFEANPGERLIISAKDIPPAERTQIQAALTRRGLPVTDAMLIKLYTARLSNSLTR